MLEGEVLATGLCFIGAASVLRKAVRGMARDLIGCHKNSFDVEQCWMVKG